MKRFLFVIFISCLVYHQWFWGNSYFAGDFPYLFSSQLQQSVFLPLAWSNVSGLGQYNVPFMWNFFPISLVSASLALLHVSWSLMAEFLYFLPVLIIPFISSYFLYVTLGFDKRFTVLAVAIFLLNSYMLMVLGGGQMLLALAISVSPFLLGFVVKQNSKFSLHTFAMLGFLYALEIGLDLRIAYILLVALACYFILKSIVEKSWKYLFMSFVNLYFLPLILSGTLHLFWILPTVFVHQNPLQQLGAIYSTSGAVKFFSFAKFEDAFGLLHPNWPENIFGLTHFMRPEFLVLPLLAYGSLLFLKPFDSLRSLREKQEQLYVLFFALLGLLGVFLAKGANDPFGGLYLWMFDHIPGFIMFRDPTKWYLLIVLSYSMLIPYTVSHVYFFLKRKFES